MLSLPRRNKTLENLGLITKNVMVVTNDNNNGIRVASLTYGDFKNFSINIDLILPILIKKKIFNYSVPKYTL